MQNNNLTAELARLNALDAENERLRATKITAESVAEFEEVKRLRALLVQAEKDRDYWKEKADDYGKKWLDMTQEYNEVLALAEQAEGALNAIHESLSFDEMDSIASKTLAALHAAGIGGSDGK